jgi:hypothetical protein
MSDRRIFRNGNRRRPKLCEKTGIDLVLAAAPSWEIDTTSYSVLPVCVRPLLLPKFPRSMVIA